MKKETQSDSDMKRRNLIDALLGDESPEDELSCDEYLQATGIDAYQLISNFEERLKAEANVTSDERATNRIHDVIKTLQKGRPQSKVTKDSYPKTLRKNAIGHGSRYWTNDSVLLLAGDENPIDVITEKAQSLIFDFMAQGAEIPIDPFALAEFRKIAVIPREDIRDARTVPAGNKLTIEFNPNRPQGRARYSICHEIVHTLFPDCQERVRNRATHEEMEADEWQLEMLCNIGAAELLMPVGTFYELQNEPVSVEKVKEWQKLYQVSTEALLLRIAKLTSQQCGMFSASRKPGASRFTIDYAVCSRTWPVRIPNGLALPKDSVVRNCTAIWYTDSGRESWLRSLSDLHVECIGIPPYPGQIHPRVTGIMRPARKSDIAINKIHYVRGNATKLRGEGLKIVAQIVNDKTPRWGAGFALAVRRKWPFVQRQFEDWASEGNNNLTLGNVHAAEVDENTTLVSLICQHGYGPSPTPRIRYGALKTCLEQLGRIANQTGAAIHLPRIGTGQAGGNWEIVEELVDETLCRRGCEVYVYTLPDATFPEVPQGRLKFE